MLVLTRREGEKLIIGGDVTVTVLAIKGSQVRFGIDAPRDVKIHREEVYRRIQKEEAGVNGSTRVSSISPALKTPLRTLSLADKG